MSAQLLALLCLLNLAFPLGLADSSSPAALELVVYLKGDGRQPAGTIEWMKRELGPLMGSAGYRIEWRGPKTTAGVTSPDALVVVELQGSCEVSTGAFTAEPDIDSLNRLASTSVSDGRVLPFATVSCSNLNRTLGPVLVSEGGARREFLYGRAIARVLAHEFYHMIVGTREHTGDGVSRSCFTTGDLLSERFTFEPAVLARFRKNSQDHAAETPPDVTGEVPATGR